MPLQKITPPTLEPLSLFEAKTHARASMSITVEDSLITALVSAAREYAENKCQRQIMGSRWKLVLDSFPGPGITGVSYVPWGQTYGLPGNAIVIPVAGVTEIESIKYTDMAGVLQTLVAGTDYVAELSEDPVRITPPFGAVWPVNVLPQVGAVQVTFKAGMAAPITVDANADTISMPMWKTLAVGDTARFFTRDRATAGDGVMPNPLVANTDYYVQSVVAPGVYKFSATSGGGAIDLTTAGTGDLFVGQLPQSLLAWMRLTVATLYENRPATVIDQRVTVAVMPSEFLDGLLDPYRLVLY